MDAPLMEWLELTVRWLHLVAGIAWIGTSFYFIFLDASLRRRGDLPEGVFGESWQIHGGGFYRMQKYRVAPAEPPERLHWFKYEAYATWLSGFLLLVLVYYLGAEIYLIDRTVLDLPVWAAVSIGVASLGLGWLVYDRLCKSPLGRHDALLGLLGFALLVLAAWGYAQTYGGRGAYIHAGSLIGTLMAANVCFIIIPNQKKAVADLIGGRSPDPALGEQARQRSVHNNYLALPVLFVMISSHYPSTFGSEWNWAILAGVMVVGGIVRHFFNLKNQGRGIQWWLWPVAAAFMAGIVTLSMQRAERPSVAQTPSFAEVRGIIERRCGSCHVSRPTFVGLDAPPKGVVFDTAEDIKREARRIHSQSVASEAMPTGNVTEMTEAERAKLAAWIAAGAPLE
ncbi:MAG: urate hydroxylase PuuD [Kiloniellaceae bacterium]